MELPPGLLERTWDYLQRGDVLGRLGLCLLAVIGLWVVTAAWSIPLGYHRSYTPGRDIVAKVSFPKADPEGTKDAQLLAARKVSYVYDQDKDPLVQLRAALQNRLVIVAGAKSLAELDKKVWQEFFPPRAAVATPLTAEEQGKQFQVFHDALATPEALAKLERAVAEAMAPYEEHGVMEKLPQQHNEGNQQEIVVVPKGQSDHLQLVKVSDVLIGEADSLKKELAERLDSPEVSQRIFAWLRGRLPTTLALNDAATKQAKEKAIAAVEAKVITISPGDMLARGGQPLTEENINLLQVEHNAFLQQLGLGKRMAYSMAEFGMFVALSVLCGVYVLHYERRLLDSWRRFATLLALVGITVGLSVLASGDNVRAELVPLMVFGMTLSIAYHRELALLFHRFGRVDRGGRHRPGPERIHDTHGRGRLGDSAGRQHPQSPKVDLRGHCGGSGGRFDHDRRGNARRAADGHDSARRLSIRHVVAVRGPADAGAAAVHRKPVRRADRPEPAGIGRRGPSAVARAGPPRAGHLQPFDQRGLDRRGGGRKRSAPTACWSASAPTSTTSARCSSRAISSRIKGTTPIATSRSCPP